MVEEEDTKGGWRWEGWKEGRAEEREGRRNGGRKERPLEGAKGEKRQCRGGS